MRVAERYILGRVLSISTMTLGSLLVIVLITQVLIFVNVVTDSGEAILTFLGLAAMLVPSVTAVVVPFALLIGICHTLNTMHTDSEIVVLEAAGASHALLVRPVVFLAALASILSLANSLVIEPAANRHLRDIINVAGSNLVKFAVRAGTFHRLENNLYIQIGGQVTGGGFEGILIADMRDPEGELIYYAQRGSIDKVEGTDVLLLENGEVQRRNAKTREVSIITFKSYALDFTHFAAARRGGNYLPKERPTAYLLEPDPNDSVHQSRPHLFRSEFHRRFSDWLYPMAFGLVALYFSVGARSNREERLWSLAAAAGVALAVRGAGFFVLNNAGGSALFALLTYLVPLSCILLFAGLLASGRRAALSQTWLDRIGAATDWLAALGARLSRRKPAFARAGDGKRRP